MVKKGRKKIDDINENDKNDKNTNLETSSSKKNNRSKLKEKEIENDKNQKLNDLIGSTKKYSLRSNNNKNNDNDELISIEMKKENVIIDETKTNEIEEFEMSNIIKRNIKDKNSKKIKVNNEVDLENVVENNENNEIESLNHKLISRKLFKGCIIDEFIIEKFEYVELVEDKSARFNGKCLDVTLNFSNLNANSNKFYKMQVFQTYDNKNDSLQLNENNNDQNFKNYDYYLFLRWGRVGGKGQTNIIKFDSKEDAVQYFFSKFEQKVTYGYKFIPIRFEDNITDLSQNNNHDLIKKEEFNSKTLFFEEIKNFLSLIFNVKMIDDQSREINYDCVKIPLGMLSSEMIEKGFSYLKQIEEILIQIDNEVEIELKSKLADKEKAKAFIYSKKIQEHRTNLYFLSGEYYAHVPHNFGFQNMANFAILDFEKLDEEYIYISELREIKINSKVIEDLNTKIISNLNEGAGLENKFIEYFNKLRFKISFIEKSSDKFQLMSNIITRNTFKPFNHRFELMSLFECTNNSKSEIIDETNFSHLVWHGSKISSYANIFTDSFIKLSKEASVSGTTFGRGIYFYDIISRAFYNCKSKNDIAIILLCKIKMNNPFELNHKKPLVENEFESENYKFDKCVKGIGTNYCEALDKNEVKILLKDHQVNEDKIIVPIGKISTIEKQDTFLPFNEYVIYDNKEIEICYAMIVKCYNLENNII